MFGSGWSWSRRSAFGECSWFVLVIRQWVVGFLLLLLLGLGCCCCCGGGGGGSSCRPRQAGSGGASPLPLEVLNCCWRRLHRRLSSLCLDFSWRRCSSWRRRSSSCRRLMLRRSTLCCRQSMSCRRRSSSRRSLSICRWSSRRSDALASACSSSSCLSRRW